LYCYQSSFHVHGRGKKDHAEGSSSMPSVQYKKLKSYLHGGFSQPNDSPERQENCDGLTPNQPLASCVLSTLTLFFKIDGFE
jgi:hypothetical protein